MVDPGFVRWGTGLDNRGREGGRSEAAAVADNTIEGFSLE